MWLCASSTRADACGLETTWLWMRRRTAWSDVQEVRIEATLGAEAFEVGVTRYAVVYDTAGRRRRLPCVDNMNLTLRRRDLDDEVEAMHAAWQRHRGPGWRPAAAVIARIRERERYGGPVERASLAAVAGTVVACALLVGGLFLDADEWDEPWSWPFRPSIFLLAVVTFALSLTRSLRRTRRRRAATAAAAPDPGPAEQIFQITPGGIVLGIAVSPDGGRVAVVTMENTAAPNIVREYAVDAPDTPLRIWSVPGPWVTDVLHLGDAIVVRVEQFMGGTRLVRLAGDEPADFGGVPIGALRQMPDGFAAVAGDDLLVLGTTDSDDLSPLPLDGTPPGTDAWTIATDPATGLVALGGRELVVLDGRTGAVVAHAAPPRRRGRVGDAVFAGNDRIITRLGRPDRAGIHDTLASWRLDGTVLICEATAPIATWGRAWPAAVRAAGGLVATVAFDSEPHLGGPPLFFDAATLAPVTAPLARDRHRDAPGAGRWPAGGDPATRP